MASKKRVSSKGVESRTGYAPPIRVTPAAGSVFQLPPDEAPPTVVGTKWEERSSACDPLEHRALMAVERRAADGFWRVIVSERSGGRETVKQSPWRKRDRYWHDLLVAKSMIKRFVFGGMGRIPLAKEGHAAALPE